MRTERPDSGFGARGSGQLECSVSLPESRVPSVVRRFRLPIPARVTLEQGRPVRVSTDRRGVSGGRVEQATGPWRSSGEWWRSPWDLDEWDVQLADGGTYRLSQDRDRQMWFVNGILD